MGLIKRPQNFLALDIGSYAIKFVEVEIFNNKVLLKNLGFGVLPQKSSIEGSFTNKDIIIDYLKKIYKEFSIKTKNCGVVIPGSKTIIKTLKLSQDSIPDGNIDSLIYQQAEQIIPFDINEIQLSYDFINAENSNEVEILIVASKKEIINTYLDILKQAGFKPCIADVDYFCLLNIYEKNYSEDYGGKVVAVLNVGAYSSNIVMLYNKKEMFNRDFNIGSAMINSNLERRLKITYNEAETMKLNNENNYILKEEKLNYFNEIKKEISRSFDLFINSSNFDKIDVLFICGGGSMSKGLKQFLEQNFELEINYFDSFKTFKVDNNIDKNYLEYISPLYTLTAGLALRGEDID